MTAEIAQFNSWAVFFYFSFLKKDYFCKKIIVNKIGTIILFCSWQCWIFAQNPVIRSVNNLSGLPSNTVYDIYQDEIGFVWVAHDKGLSRYDGKSFFNFENKSAQGKAMSNLMSYKKTIWCQDFSGNFYNAENSALKKDTLTKNSGYYSLAAMTKNGQIVSVKGDSIRSFDVLNKKINSVFIATDANPKIFEFNGNVKVLSKNKLYGLDGTVQKIENQLNPDLVFFVGGIGEKMYGLHKNVFPYVLPLFQDKKPKNSLKKGLFVQNMLVIGDEIWICTSTGAYCFDENFEPKYNGFCFFEGTSISKVLKDREGNYWFGTLNKGLFFVANLNFRIYNIENASVTALHLDKIKKQILVATEKNEIFLIDEKNRLSKKYSAGITHEILGMQSESEGTYIFSNEFSLLNSNFQKKWSKSLAVKDLAKINANLFAVAFSSGVLIFPKSRKIDDVPKWLQSSQGVWEKSEGFYRIFSAVNRGRAVCFDAKDSILYAATSKGFFYFSPKGSGEIKLNDTPIFISEIKNFDNEIYISTFSQGLLKVKNKEATPFLSKKQGLFSNAIYHFEKYEGQFWLIEDGLLQSYDVQNQSFTNYNNADGLPKAELKSVLLKENKVYLATTEGLLIFDEKQDTKNNIAPNIAITDIKINNEIGSLENNQVWKATQNNIDITFSVLSFRGEGNLKVIYKINNGDWLSIQQDARVLSLNALASGFYNIQIQAENEDGVLSNPIDFNFTIATPWYKQWYVLLSAVLLLIFLIRRYFLRRIDLIEKNNALVAEKLLLEQEVQKSMLASIKSQMNPHFLFNALNTIQAYIYTNDKENASIYLGKFSDLTRSILDMSNKETISLNEEIRTLKLYLDLEKLRFEDTLDYAILIDAELDKDWIHIPSMLVQPYVENALKHGLLHKKNDRKLNIEFKKIENSLHILIDDNGVGRKRAGELNSLKNKKHDSFASEANQKRLNILNSANKSQIVMKITDKFNAFEQAIGTQVELFIPIKN